MKPVRFGIIGCGNIVKQYLKFSKQYPILELAACADLDPQRAEEAAKEHDTARACTVDELLADDSIEMVLNLTIPAAHGPVAMQAIAAGKHVYNEKPLSLNPAEGRQLLEAAAASKLRVGCAPDTFLGTGHQLCRQLIDDGAIGTPVAAVGFMISPGVENWHPNPWFFYAPGGGPMFDMGPYYLTALMNLLGPMKRISGMAGIVKPDRTISKGALEGQKVPVTTPDHVAGHIEYESGAIATLVTSFAGYHATHDRKAPITIYGTTGTLAVPDPNGFSGEVRLRRAADEEWQVIEPKHNHPNGRSLGLADMAHAIRSNRPHRASGELAFAVLEALQGFLDSSAQGKHIDITAKPSRPAMMPVGAADGILDTATSKA